MTQVQLILLGYKISTIAVIASTLAFIAVYTRLAPWWKSPIGRTIVWKDIALVMAFLPVALSLFFHFNRLTSTLSAWIDIADFVVITVIMVIRCKVWITTHKPQSPREEITDAEPPVL
jgi:hypothetical protein